MRFGSHPLNLALRFLLELFALGAMGYWGWTQHDGFTGRLWAILLPVIAAIVWGTFAVIGDPSRSGNAPVPIPGSLRLLLEFLLFAVAALLLYRAERGSIAVILSLLTLFHYAISYDRIEWLFRN